MRMKNMGTIDRIIRILAAITIGVLYFTGILSGTAAVVLGVLALVFVVTSFMSFCPLYTPCKISTVVKDGK
jgi:hypothetical protein